MPAVLTLEPVSRTGRYTHMAKRDAPVWERFLDQYGGRYETVAYDVALGGVHMPAEDDTRAVAEGFQYSTALKIDALLFAADHALAIEVRPWATVSALGSAIAYTLVAQRDQLTELPIQPAIVCEGMQPDVRWCCERVGVVVFTV